MTNPNNKDILIYFLETFTNLPKKIISDNLEVKQEEPLNKNLFYNKGMIGDIIVKFNKYIINIEMYSVFNKESITKSICYSMRIFANQLEIGDNYNKLASFIQINIIDKVNTKFNDNFKSEYVLTDLNNYQNNILADKYILKCYRIDKVKNDTYNNDKEMRWIRFIGAKSREERENIAEGDKLLMKANEWIEKYGLDDETVEFFAKWRRKIYQDEYRKEAIREGKKEGKKIGIKEGIKEGKKEGIKEGKKEGIKEGKIEIAKTMKNEGYSIDDICKITKLSKEEIEKL